ncbi:hypothetical protein Tsubulata_006446, partial [Turnera subulata]
MIGQICGVTCSACVRKAFPFLDPEYMLMEFCSKKKGQKKNSLHGVYFVMLKN